MVKHKWQRMRRRRRFFYGTRKGRNLEPLFLLLAINYSRDELATPPTLRGGSVISTVHFQEFSGETLPALRVIDNRN